MKKRQVVFKFTIDNPDVEKRKKECDQILNQFPEKIPIICEKDPNCKLAEIDKTKFLVSNDLTVAQFNFMIRKRLDIKEEKSAFYLLVNGQFAITGDISLSDVYQKHKSPQDGFLYIIYTSQIFWG